MKPSRLLFSIVSLTWVFFLTLAVTTSPAASKTKAPPPPIDPRILIQSVNAATTTIVIQYMRDKSVHTYMIDDLTALKVNNLPGTFTDIKAGMQVRDYVERDPRTLDTLTVDLADPGPVLPVTPIKKK